MALSAFERNLILALKQARPFVEQARKSSKGVRGVGELVLIDSLLEAADNKANRKTCPTVKPGPRCKRTADMFGEGNR